MAEKTATAAKEASEPAGRVSRRETPSPASPGLASTILGLQQAAGNGSVGRLLSGAPARAVDARAFTAGNDVAQQAPLVARRRPLLQRAPAEGGEPSLAAEEAPAAGPEPATPAAAEPGAESPAADVELEPDAEPDTEPTPALVVDDEAEEVGPGQMKKGEFFARLRAESCAAAEAGLAGTEHSARGCPLIEFWLGYYERQDTGRINRDLPRFAGEGPQPASAEEAIGLIAARVRSSVATWARTGEVSGVPAGIPLPGMGLPGLGSLGGLLGGVLFKAKPGGARDPGDPVALKAQLGAGRPLDGASRSRMESVFGRGFSHVRVHTDSGAAGLATSLNAKAFTVGEHVAFGAREFRPGTLAGDALLAHELAHVAQQGDGGRPQTAAGAGYDRLESDADLAGASAVAALWGGMRSLPRPEPRLRSGLRLQRCGGCNRKKAATTAATAGPPPACEPSPESLKTVVDEARLPDETVLGFTTIDSTASKLDCIPQFAAGAAAGTCSFTPKPMRLALTSKYVKPGKYPHPKNRTQPVRNCGDVPIVFEVSGSISKRAKKAEQQHCGDLRIAFERTLKPCSEAVARLAGTTLTGKDGKECLADLTQKLGFDPRDCAHKFNELQALSGQRDIKEWHTNEPYRVSADCQELVYQYRPGKKNKALDESVAPDVYLPATTHCSGPAPASPASPASPAPAQPPQGGSPAPAQGGAPQEENR